MKQVVNDIHFDLENLKRVSATSLKINSFLSGHLFFKTKSGKFFLVLKAGEMITSDFVFKYKNKEFLLSPVNSDHVTKDIVALIEKIKIAKSENARKKYSNDLFDYCKDILNDYDESILAICLSFFEKLYRLPKKNLSLQYETSSIINQRSLVIATIVTMIAISDSHCDYDFLRDIFSLSFHLDVGLLEEGDVCYHLIKACERERENKDGRLYLESIQENKLNLFIKHPISSYEYLKKQEHFFKNKRLLNIVKNHHEDQEGTGFPFSKIYEAVSDIELYLNSADKVISFDMQTFGIGDCVEFLYEIKEYSKKTNYAFLKKFSETLTVKIRSVA